MTNFYFNLTEKLQGCSKQKGMVVCTSNPDGQPTVNRQSAVTLQSGKRSEKEQLSSTCLRSASDLPPFRSRYLRCAAMILCVLVMSVGQMWGATYTWTFDNSSSNSDVILENKTTELSAYTSSGKSMSYVGGSSCKIAKKTAYLAMGGESKQSSGALSTRYFILTAPSANGTISVTFAGTASGNELIRTDNGDYQVIAAATSTTKVSSLLSGLTAGTTKIYIAFTGKCYISSIAWTDADAPEALTTLYSSDYKSSMESGASISVSSSGMVEQTGGSGWVSAYSKYYKATSTNKEATITFSPALSLVSDGNDRGKIRIYYGSTDKYLNATVINDFKINGGSSIGTAYGVIEKEKVHVIEYTIPVGTSTLTTIYNKIAVSNGCLLHVEVLTHAAAPSDSYDIHIGKNNADYSDESLTNTSGTTWSKNITLDAGSYYEFKVKKTSGSTATWYGNNGRIFGTVASWDFSTSDGNCKFYTSVAGSYTFSWDASNNKLSVTYPAGSHPTKCIYMACGTGTWCDATPKFYVHSWLDSNTADTELTVDACDGDVYTAEIPWFHDYVIITRQDPSSTGIAWDGDKFWNRSNGDFYLNNYNKLTFTGWTDGKGNFSGGTYSPTTYTVTTAASTAGYGTVSAASVTGVACGTSISASTNTLTVGTTNVTAAAAESTAQYTYAFDGWSWTPAGATVTNNVTATANFTRTLNSYTVTWKNGSTTLETDASVDYGETPTYNGSTPTKAADALYTYTFSGWSPAVGAISGNTTYSAQFTATPKTVAYGDATIYAYNDSKRVVSGTRKTAMETALAGSDGETGISGSLPLLHSVAGLTSVVLAGQCKSEVKASFPWLGSYIKMKTTSTTATITFNVASGYAGTATIYFSAYGSDKAATLTNDANSESITSDKKSVETEGNQTSKNIALVSGANTLTISGNNGYISRIDVALEASCTSVAAPTALTCSAHTSSSLTFTWTKATNASGYVASLYGNSACTGDPVASSVLGDEATVTFSTLTASTTYYCKVQSKGNGSTYCAAGGTTSAASGTTSAAAITGSTSVNIEQGVLTNSKNWSYTSALTSANITYDLSSGCSLDSLNDACDKTDRNNNYLGLKIKSSGKYIQVTLPADKTLKVRFGYRAAVVKVWIDEVAQTDIPITDTYYNYELPSSVSNRTVKIATSSDGAVVIKQIMIGEAIASVTLPAMITLGSTTNGTISVASTKVNVGSTVTVTATPSSGYELATLTYKKDCPADFTPVDIKDAEEFTMPNGNVTINATFAASCTAPTTAFANGAYTVGGSALDLSTLISSNNSSGAITYTVKNANGTDATIAGSSFTATSAGTATVTATQAADATYCEKVMDATITVSAPAATLYTVTYAYNGATGGNGTASVMQASEDASVTLANPTRTGFEFDGWYKTDGTKVSSPYTPTADITLYARWEEECAVVGGSGSTKIIGFTTATCSEKASSGGECTLSSVTNLTVAHEIHDGGDGDDSLMVNTEAKVAMYYGSNSKVYSRGAYRWIKGLSSLGKSNNTVGFSTTVGSEYQFTIDSISFGIGASANFTYQIIIYQSGDTLYKSPIRTVTNYNSSSSTNHEFHVNGLSAQTKLQNLTGTFYVRVRVCQASTGKYFYLPMFQVIGNLHETGGGGGTCHHVYYHGNGADEGFVADTTSYADAEEVTVLDYDDSRYPLAKDGYEFRGWATSAGGSVAYSAGDKITIDGADVALHAVWVAESDALVTWKMKTATDEAWATTTGTGTTDGTNISSIGTSHDEGDNKAKNSATAKTAMASGEVSSTAAPSNSANFTFTIGATKQVEINKFDCKVFNVASGSRTYKAQISDAAGNVYNSTNKVAVSAEATLTDASFVFGSGKILRGAVTIRIYAWGSGSEFRMGPDVKFYGTVEDYECATPDAPTISGVSEYVPGQTITLTASHDGENYDNLTTYTWYKGDTWGDKSKVQDPATGESGYTLTIDECTTGDAGLYWCEAANGTCKAHNAAGYDVTVFPAYTITYHLDGGSLDGTQKTTYTQFDEDYTLPTPTKTGYVFAGWYGASDFSGLPTVVLGAGSVGNKEYYAKWGAVVTVSWTVTKVDGELYRGGGGYSVKAVINETNWSTGFMDELELTATEGVTLKNIVVSENDESKVQVTADFDITTGLAADATSITFTLNVPADGTYGPKVDEHEEDLTSCAGSSTVWNFAYASDDRPTLTSSNAGTEGNKNTLSATTGSGNLYYFAGSSDAFETDKYLKMNGASSGGSVNNRSVYQNRCFYIDITSNGTLTIQQYADNGNGAPKYVVANTRPLQSDYPSSSVAPTTTGGATYEINVTNYSSGTADRIWVAYPTAKAYIISVTWTPTGGGGTVTPTLTWTPALNTDADWDSGNNRLNKETGDPDFTFVANQNKNSLGAITYESSDPAVATVNAAGTVHIVGAAGDATITATLAASGCFEEATATYNIHVVDNCADVAGTISATDLGCDGIQMTVSGHTATASVSYQWYKDGVSLGDTYTNPTCTVTVAGEYYVVVDNSAADGDHCSMASTNTIKVAAKAAISVPTNIVDSWYVKNGRRTPDIALWKTTGVSTFTVKNNAGGATIENIGGCTFYLGDDGIIYLKGTTSTGAAPSDMETGDLVIKAEVNDECGSNTKTSSTITIHCQAATNYKEIAFVADGGKGMRKDSITVGHGDGTELYEYLDSVGTAAKNRLFQLSERNIYWTTDEKAIREEYSQFDAILITDDPSTNTVVKNGDDYKTKGYVNAFGTMVDVRPIFTMEAYVSALKNWGAKGIAGNPESPNPRQYEMRLECKDHEIYGAGLPDPEDGTNVWEEVIDGETFRHVILVDSTLGIYKGVAYNAETAGNKKPALQGFTGEAAGSLLGLGRILEGTLQAAIERQEEPAARLLVMGINAKALQPTCALTNEGKAVIKNILTYLLKTNMEEVDDCSNYFTGKIDNDWSKADNWSKKSLPSSEAKVRILAPCVISGIQPHVLQVSIVNSGNSNIRYTARNDAVCNGTLTIEPDGALIADGKIRSAVAPHFAANDLMPTTPEMLTINTGSDAQAALIFNNEEGLTKATVNLYSLGRNDGSYKYQYFAIPMEYVSVSPAFANETHGGTKIYTYVYNEASSGWTRRGYYDDLYAFEGLGITTKSSGAMNYTMTGTLASTATKEITLTHADKGLNLIGNSWMAPIQIGALAEDNTDANITKTVYIYCAGRDAVKGEATSGVTETAGQWLAVPFEAAEFATWKATGKLSVIPAMQAFQIKTAAEATLTLDYDKVVRGSTNDLNAKLRAPRRRVAAKEVTMTNIRVSDSKTHTDLSLFEGERFSDEFDNGWEAEYMNGDGRSAKLYAETVDGKMAVVAMTDYEGTMVGFAPGQERVYIFSFMGADNGYYLNDIKMQQSVRISEGETYSFTYEDGDDASRFMISRTPFEKPGVATGTENIDASVPQARKILYNDKLYIIRGGHMYDATGKMVK